MKKRKRTPQDFVLIGRMFAEVGSGGITRAFLSLPGYEVHGLQMGRQVYINEDHFLADTILHECLHRAFPSWSENYVRRTTSYLKNRMSDEEIIALVAEYRKRARTRKRPLRVED